MSQRISELGEMCAPGCTYVVEEPQSVAASDTSKGKDNATLWAAASVAIVAILLFIVRMDDIREVLK